MKFFKDPAHIRTLLLHLLAGGAASVACFFADPTWGLTMAIICVMFTAFRLIGDISYDARVRALCRRMDAALQAGVRPTAPSGGAGALSELESSAYKLALKAADNEMAVAQTTVENSHLLACTAAQLTARSEELPANVHRRELIALAQDMIHLSELPETPVAAEEIAPTSVEDIWHDVTVLTDETLRMKQITVNAEIAPRTHVMTCPRAAVVGGLCGLVETCARHSDHGADWKLSARKTAAFTEFRLSSDRFDWDEQTLASLFDPRRSTEPATLYLSRLAARYDGEVRTERAAGQKAFLLRFYNQSR